MKCRFRFLGKEIAELRIENAEIVELLMQFCAYEDANDKNSIFDHKNYIALWRKKKKGIHHFFHSKHFPDESTLKDW